GAMAAVLVQMPISRTREYSAVNIGAHIAGGTDGLASALVKISDAAHHVENDTAERNPATAHLFIINPLSGHRMDNLFSTHPSTENRIAALNELARELDSRARYAPQPAGGPSGGVRGCPGPRGLT